MPTAGKTTVTTVGTTIYDGEKGGCTKFWVSVTDASSYGALFYVAGVHADDEWVHVDIGNSLEFRAFHQGISQVQAKGDGGAAEVSYTISSMTMLHQM